MDVQVSFQATLNNPLNNFVVAWALNSAPLTIINTIVPVKPYGSPWQVTIPGLTAGQLYIITLWESTSTTPTGTNRNSAQYLPNSSITTIRTPDYLVTDATPGLVSNTNTYVNTTYAGWQYSVERVPGTMYPQGAPNVIDPDYAQDPAGGFHLVRSGDIFGPAEKFVVRFLPNVAPVTAGNTGVITTGQIITTGRALDTTYLNQALFLQGSSGSLPITLPVLSSVSDYQYLYFFSAGGSHVSAPITCAGTDKIQRRGLVTNVILCQNEVLKIFKANGVWCIDYISPTVDMVGEVVYKYTNLDFNYVLADGAVSGLLSRTTYARLYAYMNTLDASAIISETLWAHVAPNDGTNYFDNKGKWTQGDGSTNFRVPLLYNYHLRPVDGSTRKSGSFGIETIRAHTHTTFGSPITAGPDEPFYPGSANGAFSGAGADHFGRNATPDTTMRTGNDNGVNISGRFSPTETTPSNVGIYALIRL